VLGSEILVISLSVYIYLIGMESKLSDHEKAIRNVVTIAEDILRVASESVMLADIIGKMANIRDETAQGRYEGYLNKLKELAAGLYELTSLDEVYRDDVVSINRLRKGEILRSTCPVSPGDTDTQFADDGFVKSTNAHKNAAGRGVQVRRVFIFPTRAVAHSRVVKGHIADLRSSGVQVKAIFRDEPRHRMNNMLVDDFLIFGELKVSIGVIEPGSWKIRGANVHMDKESVIQHTKNYDHLFEIADDI
jgi:hypothetical protein